MNLSFYDWYCDLPTAFPEIWGEQTDVCESADWYNAKMIADMGACLNMTRTPDCHFFAESRHNGTKAVVFSPDFSQVCKYADQWVPLHAGSDGAFWMATTHVILKEFHHEKQTPYFIDYVKKYTDSPYLVKLEKDGENYKPGRLLRANEDPAVQDVSERRLEVRQHRREHRRLRGAEGQFRLAWDEKQGNWNMKPENVVDDKPYDPVLTLLGRSDEVRRRLHRVRPRSDVLRGVPVMRVETTEGPVCRDDGLRPHDGPVRCRARPAGRLPRQTTTTRTPPTRPAWQEIFTGVASDTVLQFAREWASTADVHRRQVHDHHRGGHQPLVPRQPDVSCRSHGPDAHRVHREERRWSQPLRGAGEAGPMDSWGAIAFGKDWQGAVRLQQAPIWHYMNTCQYRYDGQFSKYNTVPDNETTRTAHGRPDLQVGSHGLDAVLPAVRPEHAGRCAGRPSRRGHDDERSRSTFSRS